MAYVHRAERDRRAAAACSSVPEGLEERLVGQTAKVLLEHRQRVRAGVPGCTCEVEFDSYLTMPEEHARHVAAVTVAATIAAIRTSGVHLSELVAPV